MNIIVMEKVKIKQINKNKNKNKSKIIDGLVRVCVSKEYHTDSERKFPMCVGIYIWNCN